VHHDASCGDGEHGIGDDPVHGFGRVPRTPCRHDDDPEEEDERTCEHDSAAKEQCHVERLGMIPLHVARQVRPVADRPVAFEEVRVVLGPDRDPALDVATECRTGTELLVKPSDQRRTDEGCSEDRRGHQERDGPAEPALQRPE